MFRAFSIDPGSFGAPYPNQTRGAQPALGSPAPALPASLIFFPIPLKPKRNLVFSSWKTKPSAGRKRRSRLTPSTTPKSPPFISMWPLQSPQPGKYLPPLAWLWPVGGEKNLVLNVPALRARDMSRRQETPGAGSRARLCHGNHTPGIRVSLGQSCSGAGSLSSPDRQLVLSQLTVTPFVLF